MPTPLVLDVQADINNAKAGLKTVGDGIDSIGKSANATNAPLGNVAGNIDKLSKKTSERLGAYLFQDLAMSAASASNGLNSVSMATRAAEVAFSTAGRAAMLFTGNLGFVVMAGASLFTVFRNMKQGAEETTDEFLKNTGTLTNNQNAIESLIDETNKFVSLSDSEKRAIREGNELIKAQIREKLNLVRADLEQASSAKTRTELNSKLAQYEAASFDGTKGTYEDYRNAVKNAEREQAKEKETTRQVTEAGLKLASVKTLLIELDKKQTERRTGRAEESLKAIEKQQALASMEAQQTAQRLMATNDITAARAMEAASIAEVEKAEKAYQAALIAGDDIQIKKKAALLRGKQEELAVYRDTTKAIVQLNKQQLAQYSAMTQAATDLFVAQNGKILLNARSVFAEEIKAFASMEAAKAEMKALENIERPWLAAAYLAAAVAIRAAGSAASAAIVAGGQDAGAAGGTATTTGAATTETASAREDKSSKLTVNITGAVGWSKDTVVQLAKELSKVVQTNNVTLVSSDLRLKSGGIPL